MKTFAPGVRVERLGSGRKVETESVCRASERASAAAEDAIFRAATFPRQSFFMITSGASHASSQWRAFKRRLDNAKSFWHFKAFIHVSRRDSARATAAVSVNKASERARPWHCNRHELKAVATWRPDCHFITEINSAGGPAATEEG